jgi:hypothetical protein
VFSDVDTLRHEEITGERVVAHDAEVEVAA